ncbi:m164 protein [Murid betaherpesvirus 1]|uniref:M164 n=1 Tax=Muromegalovirus G4 TaxID=524650 RepID=B3UXB1_MUHV1|nr:m164 [Muromegalovirus G4]QNL29310.1 m164 [Muromegalovirus G4]UNW45390.1 m164 protein [Murid betaherpesvirus 1]
MFLRGCRRGRRAATVSLAGCGEPELPMCRRRVACSHFDRGSRGGTRVGPRGPRCVPTSSRRPRRRYRRRLPFCIPWTEEDRRSRRLFKAGMLALIYAAASAAGTASASAVGSCVDGVLSDNCMNKIYPDQDKAAVICHVKPGSVKKFVGSWSFALPEGRDFQTTTIATFDAENFHIHVAGFTGMADALSMTTELWPPSGFSGLVVCDIDHVSQTMCLIPPPLLRWVPGEELLTIEPVVPDAAEPFGKDYCRTWGADAGPPRYSRIFWAVNNQAIVAAGEETLGTTDFLWMSNRLEGFTVNASDLALSFPIRSDLPVCVSCVVGSGGNLLSLPTIECRPVHVARSSTGSKSCDCQLERFLAAFVVMLCITIVTIVAYIYLVSDVRPSLFPTFEIRYFTGGVPMNGVVSRNHQPWRPATSTSSRVERSS